MSKPFKHSKSSAKKYRGIPDDYDEIHNAMDSSKAYFAGQQHRSLFHHSAGCFYMEKLFGVYFEGIKKIAIKYNLPFKEFESDMVQFLKDNRQFGTTFKNTDGIEISVRDIVEQHILEDFNFKFLPTPQDYLQEMDFKSWMQNGMGEPPSSHKKLDSEYKKYTKTKKELLLEESDTDFIFGARKVMD